MGLMAIATIGEGTSKVRKKWSIAKRWFGHSIVGKAASGGIKLRLVVTNRWQLVHVYSDLWLSRPELFHSHCPGAEICQQPGRTAIATPAELRV